MRWCGLSAELIVLIYIYCCPLKSWLPRKWKNNGNFAIDEQVPGVTSKSLIMIYVIWYISCICKTFLHHGSHPMAYHLTKQVVFRPTTFFFGGSYGLIILSKFSFNNVLFTDIIVSWQSSLKDVCLMLSNNKYGISFIKVDKLFPC